jgi:hypothetical protein
VLRHATNFVEEDAPMSERPEQLERLDDVVAGVRIAHETIFDMHSELLERDPGQDASTGLVAESAQIASLHVPRLTSVLRSLATRWHEQALLDPEAADRTAGEAAAEFGRIEPELTSLVTRRREINAELRDLLSGKDRSRRGAAPPPRHTDRPSQVRRLAAL